MIFKTHRRCIKKLNSFEIEANKLIFESNKIKKMSLYEIKDLITNIYLIMQNIDFYSKDFALYITEDEFVHYNKYLHDLSRLKDEIQYYVDNHRKELGLE